MPLQDLILPLPSLPVRIDELRKLYPDLSPDDLERVRETLDRYLLLAWEVWEEMKAKKEIDVEPSGLPLTDPHFGFTMQGKVDSPKQTNPQKI